MEVWPSKSLKKWRFEDGHGSKTAFGKPLNQTLLRSQWCETMDFWPRDPYATTRNLSVALIFQISWPKLFLCIPAFGTIFKRFSCSEVCPATLVKMASNIYWGILSMYIYIYIHNYIYIYTSTHKLSLHMWSSDCWWYSYFIASAYCCCLDIPATPQEGCPFVVSYCSFELTKIDWLRKQSPERFKHKFLVNFW